jgi:membrane dipeptidase
MRRSSAAALCAAGVFAAAPASGDETTRERAARVHASAIVVDGHNDLTTFLLDHDFELAMDGSGADKQDPTFYWFPVVRWFLPEPGPDVWTDTDLGRLREGGVDAQFFSIFVDSSHAEEPGASRARAQAMIDVLVAQVAAHPERIELARTAADVRRIAEGGRIAALMGIEGGHAIENDLDVLREFARQGVRYLSPTWNNANDWADSCYEHPNGGLTEFGRDVVREMNLLGVVVDASHSSDDTLRDVLEVSRAPLLASHSSARALVDHPRNLSDELLRAVAANGGVVMVNFQTGFIDPDKIPPWGFLWHVLRNFGVDPTPASYVADHIEHIARVAGSDHVGLGSDFAGAPLMMPEGLKDVTGFPLVTEELARRGWSDEGLVGLLGGNALRVLEANERVAAELAVP